MPQPKRRHSRARRDKRRSSNWKIELGGLSKCSNPACGKMRPPHTICPHCGFYNGQLVLAPKAKKKDQGKEGGEEQQG
jgi:large subunit ribosomal protein L32